MNFFVLGISWLGVSATFLDLVYQGERTIYEKHQKCWWVDEETNSSALVAFYVYVLQLFSPLCFQSRSDGRAGFIPLAVAKQNIMV
jgi:hypothetical protein